MRTTYCKQLVEEIRRIVSPEAAASLEGAALTVPCPNCKQELVHRGVVGGRAVWECLRDRRIYVDAPALALHRGDFGGAVKALPPVLDEKEDEDVAAVAPAPRPTRRRAVAAR